MHSLIPSPVVAPLKLRLDPIVELDDEGLFQLCRGNRDLRIERNPDGELVMMSPAGGKTSYRNAEIVAQLRNWARQDGTGLVFDSSAGFTLPGGAMRSPDAAWVEKSRLRALSREQRERFLPLCPAFVIELRSPSDPLSAVESKMREYVDCGARLGWLIDPVEQRLHIYRPGAEVEILTGPERSLPAPELPGLILELVEIWDPDW